MQKGTCLCKAVTIDVTGDPVNVRICHCHLCQKSMGSPFFARALFLQDHIKISGDVARHSSSVDLDRVFCPQCGTTLGAWRKNGTVAGVALTLFDDRNAFKPQEHIWLSEKVSWLEITDGLPGYEFGAPE